MIYTTLKGRQLYPDPQEIPLKGGQLYPGQQMRTLLVRVGSFTRPCILVGISFCRKYLCQPVRSQVYVFAAEILSKCLSEKSINSL